MEIIAASVLDLTALNKLEHACFGRDAWPILDLIAVLTFPEVTRLKAVEDGRMIGFVAGDMHNGDGLGWIATIGIDPEYRRHGYGRELLRADAERRRHAPIRAGRFSPRRRMASLLQRWGRAARHGKGPRRVNSRN